MVSVNFKICWSRNVLSQNWPRYHIFWASETSFTFWHGMLFSNTMKILACFASKDFEQRFFRDFCLEQNMHGFGFITVLAFSGKDFIWLSKEYLGIRRNANGALCIETRPGKQICLTLKNIEILVLFNVLNISQVSEQEWTIQFKTF